MADTEINKDTLVVTDTPNQVTNPVTETGENPKSDKELNFSRLRTKTEALEKELEEYRQKEKDRTEKELAEQGRLKELAELKAKEADELRQELQNIRSQSTIKDKLTEAGVNPKYIKFAINELKDQVKFNNDGDVEGISEAIANIKTNYPEWLSNQTFGNIGANISTSPKSSGRVYTLKEIQDNEFYKANEADILKAYKEGRIK